MTYRDVISIWWGMVWRGMIMAVPATIVASFVVALFLAFSGLGQTNAIIGAIIGYVTSIPVSIWALRASLIRHGLGKIG